MDVIAAAPVANWWAALTQSAAAASAKIAVYELLAGVAGGQTGHGAVLPKLLQDHGAGVAAVSAAIVFGCALACCCIAACAAGSGAAVVWWLFVKHRREPPSGQTRSASSPLEDVAAYLEAGGRAAVEDVALELGASTEDVQTWWANWRHAQRGSRRMERSD